MVMPLLQWIFESPLPLDPLHLLLGLPFPGLGRALNNFASLILLAAKRVILMCCLSPFPPSHDQFLQVIGETRRMEHMKALEEDAFDRFNRVWDLWDKSEFGSSL